VKLDARMRRTDEATTPKDADLHAEVAAIFLGHQVGGSLGSPEERMERTVDAAIFVDAVVILGPCIFPPGLELLEGKFAGGVAVHLVGAEKNEKEAAALARTRLEFGLRIPF